MEAVDTDTDTTGPGTAPVKAPETPRVYTQEEVEAKLRGQGKKLAEYEAKLAAVAAEKAKQKEAETAAKRKQAEEQGQYKELLTATEQRAADLEAKLAAIQERETARMESVTTENEKRRKSLPKALADLIPDGLDADAVARQIDRLEKLKGDKSVTVHGGGGRSNDPVDAVQTAISSIHSKLVGGAK